MCRFSRTAKLVKFQVQVITLAMPDESDFFQSAEPSFYNDVIQADSQIYVVMNKLIDRDCPSIFIHSF